MKKEKYFLYARKSSESDEKQVQSIDDQINVMKRKAENLWIEIVEVFQESMSAKAPWRIKFSEMIGKINSWKVEGVISWKLDRLSRNPIDSGTIQYMLQIQKLKKVITIDREYYPVDAGLLMSVENGMSNQFLLDLSKNVKRGIQSKVDKWWFPWVAPLWYINELKNHTIIPDEEKFYLVQKIWKMMLSWNYTVSEIRDIANNKWFLRTVKWNKISKSSMYSILNNVFYTWDFMFKWELKKWIHKPMITYEEYNRVQELLGTSWKAKLVKHNFSYTWIIKCWECGSMVTAGDKTKYIKSTNSIKKYSYYWCTKKVKTITQNCSQKSIRQEDLEKQIITIIWNIEIIPDFKVWAINIIKNDFKQEKQEREVLFNTLYQKEKQTRNKIDKLTDMLLDNKITDTVFDKKKKSFELEIKQIQESITNIDQNRKKKIDEIEKVFDFACKAKYTFENWDYKIKKIIVKNLGLHFKLIDWKLDVDLFPWFKVIQNNQEALKRQKWQFAPQKNSISKVKTDTISSSIPIWQGL